MPNRNRQRTNGVVAPWGQKLMPYERGDHGENELCLPGYGRKKHPVWGTKFQLYKRMSVETKNPFVSGPTKYCDSERLQAPTGVPNVMLTVSGEVGLHNQIRPPPPDDARPWILEGQNQTDAEWGTFRKPHYSSRSGNGTGSVVQRPPKPPLAFTWTKQKPRVERPHTSYQQCVELSKEANRMRRQAKPRPQSAARAAWKNWEDAKDKERTRHSVTKLCNRAHSTEQPKFARNSGLADQTAADDSVALLSSRAEEEAEVYMRKKALQNVTKSKRRPMSAVPTSQSRINPRGKFQPPSQRTAGSGKPGTRPTSAGPRTHSQERCVSTAIRPEAVINYTLDIPDKWCNATSVSYELTEQTNAKLKQQETVVP